MGFPGDTIGKEPACQFRKNLTSLSCFYAKSGTGRLGMARYKSRENLEQIFRPSAFFPVAVCISPGCLEWKQHTSWKFLSKRPVTEVSPCWRSPSPGECALQYIRVLDRCHRADEVQHDEPVPRRGGRGGRQWQGDPGTEAEDPPSSPADPHQEPAPRVPGDGAWKWVRLWMPVPAPWGLLDKTWYLVGFLFCLYMFIWDVIPKPRVPLLSERFSVLFWFFFLLDQSPGVHLCSTSDIASKKWVSDTRRTEATGCRFPSQRAVLPAYVKLLRRWNKKGKQELVSISPA